MKEPRPRAEDPGSNTLQAASIREAPGREGQTKLVAGRSSGSRVVLPPRLPIGHPQPDSGMVAAVVAGHSGASAADSHGLPCWPRLRGTCNADEYTHCAEPVKRENHRLRQFPSGGPPRGRIRRARGRSRSAGMRGWESTDRLREYAVLVGSGAAFGARSPPLPPSPFAFAPGFGGQARRGVTDAPQYGCRRRQLSAPLLTQGAFWNAVRVSGAARRGLPGVSVRRRGARAAPPAAQGKGPVRHGS